MIYLLQSDSFHRMNQRRHFSFRYFQNIIWSFIKNVSRITRRTIASSCLSMAHHPLLIYSNSQAKWEISRSLVLSRPVSSPSKCGYLPGKKMGDRQLLKVISRVYRRMALAFKWNVLQLDLTIKSSYVTLMTRDKWKAPDKGIRPIFKCYVIMGMLLHQASFNLSTSVLTQDDESSSKS